MAKGTPSRLQYSELTLSPDIVNRGVMVLFYAYSLVCSVGVERLLRQGTAGGRFVLVYIQCGEVI